MLGPAMAAGDEDDGQRLDPAMRAGTGDVAHEGWDDRRPQPRRWDSTTQSSSEIAAGRRYSSAIRKKEKGLLGEEDDGNEKNRKKKK